MERPYIIISIAQSLDGFICRHDGNSSFSSDEDLVEVHKLRSSVDGILVGIGTVLKDDPRLTVHKIDNRDRENPLRIVFDSKGRTPLESKILNEEAATVIFVSKAAPNDSVLRLQMKNSVLVAGETKIDLKAALLALLNLGVKKLMVEGGAEIISSFLEAGAVDEMRVSISPEICGSGLHLSAMRHQNGINQMWDLVDLKRLGESVVVTIKNRDA